MNHGYEYNVSATPLGEIHRVVTYVEPGATGMSHRTEVMRQVIDATDVLTRKALIDLGWIPPAPPMPPMPPMPPRRCIVKDCMNHSDQGKFVGDLCMPCHTMLTTGNIKSGATFIHDLRDRMRKIANIAT